MLGQLIGKLSNYRKISAYACLLMIGLEAFFLTMSVLGVGYWNHRVSHYVAGLIGSVVISVLVYFKFTRGYNEAIKKLSEKSKIYEKELENTVLEAGNHIFTENYVFFEYGLKICEYDEIIMVYVATVPNRGRMCKKWSMITKKGKIYTITIESKSIYHGIKKYNENLELDNLLKIKNPNILVGKTKENLKVLRQKYKIRGIL